MKKLAAVVSLWAMAMTVIVGTYVVNMRHGICFDIFWWIKR